MSYAGDSSEPANEHRPATWRAVSVSVVDDLEPAEEGNTASGGGEAHAGGADEALGRGVEAIAEAAVHVLNSGSRYTVDEEGELE